MDENRDQKTTIEHKKQCVKVQCDETEIKCLENEDSEKEPLAACGAYKFQRKRCYDVVCTEQEEKCKEEKSTCPPCELPEEDEELEGEKIVVDQCELKEIAASCFQEERPLDVPGVCRMPRKKIVREDNARSCRLPIKRDNYCSVDEDDEEEFVLSVP